MPAGGGLASGVGYVNLIRLHELLEGQALGVRIGRENKQAVSNLGQEAQATSVTISGDSPRKSISVGA